MDPYHQRINFFLNQNAPFRKYWVGSSMPVITLTTDFGDRDAYVAIMKGVILTINPRSTIVDITHRIDPQNIRQAAYLISGAYQYFPKDTVHILIVDPGVGSSRSIIALRSRGHIFLAPNNGILSLLLTDKQIDSTFRVDNDDFFLDPVSNTFHGRDIFAPVGARLSLGLPLDKLGSEIDASALIQLELPKVQLTKNGSLRGAVIDIDRFGNLVTNLDWNTIKWHYSKVKNDQFQFVIGKHRIGGLSRTYDDVAADTPLALIGSRGLIEISINRGNAAMAFEATVDTPVLIRIM
jgi:S-adenosylmethionine hydrolase